MEKRIIKKEIAQEEYAYILFNLLEMLNDYYQCNMSEKVEESMHNLIRTLQEEMTKEYPKDCDIVDIELTEKITFVETDDKK